MLAGISVDRTYDTQFRLQRLELKHSGVTQTRERFAYDSISWLDYIADETPDGSSVLRQFDYTFKPNTPFVQSIVFSHGGTMIMTQSYVRDSLGRLSGASAVWAGGGNVDGVNYQFDELNRRTNATLSDGSKWDYGYNGRNEVTAGKKKLPSGVFAGGHQFEYNYDDIGNRTVVRFGGDAAGANLRESVYGLANTLNQLTTRQVPGSIWLAGDAPTNLTLLGAVDGRAFPVQRQEGGRFFAEAAVNNAAAPAFARLTVVGKDGANVTDIQTGHEYVPRTPEAFLYDADGNLVSDGRWTNFWNCENQLVAMESLPAVPDTAKKRLEFKYDYQGRRVEKTVYAWTGSQYTAQSTNRFVYDGWNLLAVLDGQASVVQSFRWGLDLSGTMQGAGGVGGLLSMTSTNGAQAGSYFYGYDGRGNVTVLLNATNGAEGARYEYGPFSEVLRATGPLARFNRFCGSTKIQDEETDLLYYGYRYLSTANGRWLNRDPLGESSSRNIYGFVNNDPVQLFDVLGLWGSQGHFYGPYAAGVIANLNPNNHLNPTGLGFYGELPDEMTTATAFGGGQAIWSAIANIFTFELAVPDFRRIQRLLHSLDGGRAENRRACLRRLLRDALSNPNTPAWELGFLIHAFGDAYAHSYVDPWRWTGSPKGGHPNPNFGQEVLYNAPWGHGFDGHTPDLVRANPDKFNRYFVDLVTTLNNAPLSPDQQNQVNAFLNAVQNGLANNPNQDESEVFRNIVTQPGYGYPANGYDPDQGGPFRPNAFPNVPNLNDIHLPTEPEIQDLLRRIRRACCRR
jgi:RHS repeat-associated protein